MYKANAATEIFFSGMAEPITFSVILTALTCKKYANGLFSFFEKKMGFC